MNDIINSIYGHGRGWVFSPNDFVAITPRSNIRIILHRLTNAGTVRRIMRGLYDYPRKSKYAEGFLSPDPEQVAQALARKFRWRIHPSGETALNFLGLSTQVPAQYLYQSDGPTRTFKWDGGKLSFKHTRRKDLAELSPKSALVVSALKALGKERIDNKVLGTLRRKISINEKKALLKETRFITGWIYDTLLKICGDKQNA